MSKIRKDVSMVKPVSLYSEAPNPKYICDCCGSGINMRNQNNSYMLHDDLWKAIHKHVEKGFLCFDCMWTTFVKVFQRPPVASDFTRCNCAVNLYLRTNEYMDERLTSIRNSEYVCSLADEVHELIAEELKCAWDDGNNVGQSYKRKDGALALERRHHTALAAYERIVAAIENKVEE